MKMVSRYLMKIFLRVQLLLKKEILDFNHNINKENEINFDEISFYESKRCKRNEYGKHFKCLDIYESRCSARVLFN